MKYQVFGNTIVARMDRGEEILAEVKEICTRENIRLASISALGAVSHVLVGLYQMENKSYYSITLDKDMELTALVGNVTTKDGEVYLHLHATFSDINGNAFGGHLNEAVISGTCEMFIQKIDGDIGRCINPDTGLNQFDL